MSWLRTLPCLCLCLGMVPTEAAAWAGAKRGRSAKFLKANHAHEPWRQGSGVVLDNDERRLFIADRSSNVVTELDANTMRHRRRHLCKRPERMVVAPDTNVVYVTCRLERAVLVIHPSKGTSRIKTGAEPLGIALSRDGRTLLVTASAENVVHLFSATGEELARIETPEPWPWAVTTGPVGRDDRAFVTHRFGGAVHEIDLAKKKIVRQLSLPTQSGGAHRRDFDFAARTPNLAEDLFVSPDGKRLVVSHVLADTGKLRTNMQGTGYGRGARAPLLASLTSLSLDTGKVLKGPNVGPLSPDVGVRVMSAVSQPVAVAHHPTRKMVAQVARGSNRVVLFDAAMADLADFPRAVLYVGSAPRALVFSKKGDQVYVLNEFDFTVSKVGLTKVINRLPVTAKPPKALVSRANFVERVARVPAKKSHRFGNDPLPKEARLGRKLFTLGLNKAVSGRNGFACASCHPDGRTDGLTWHIGQGPRQTPILAGRLRGTAPFNWKGSEDNLADNLKVTTERLGGTGLSKVELESLAIYVRDHLPGFDRPEIETPKVDRGRALFSDVNVGCASCHVPEAEFTDGQRHVLVAEKKRRGKRKKSKRAKRVPPGYDTPSLKHLWASAPYMHDGGVSTIEGLLSEWNAHDHMGKTSHLSKSDIESLAAYLKTL